MPAENEKIFVRRIKRGYLATYNGVKGKARTMFEAIEKAQRNYIEQDEANEINYSKLKSKPKALLDRMIVALIKFELDVKEQKEGAE
jgi:hypothetical protein